MLKTINVREVLASQTNNLWESLPDKCILAFDNGEKLETNKKHIIYTSYYWDILRHYPNIIITSKHFLTHHIQKKPYGSDTHRSLIESFYKDIIMSYNLITPLSRDSLNELIFQVNNNAYNELSTRLYEYMSSIDILDFIDATETPEIIKIVKDCDQTEEAVSRASNDIYKVLIHSPALDNNRLAKACRNQIVRINQVIQCIGIRGYNTDVESTIFEHPIMTGYVRGLHGLHDSMIESRSAAKALLFAKEPLKDSEYLSRKIQLLAMTLERVHYTDCGSQKYLDCFVQPEVKDEFGNVTDRGWFYVLQGVYFYDDSIKVVRPLTLEDNHLIGKWIKIRSPIAGCDHPDPQGVCSVCFGELSQNIQPGANIGHLTGSILGQIISQLILSTKHHEKSANASFIKLGKIAQQFFTTDAKRDKYYLNEGIKDKDFYIEIDKDELTNLNDIVQVENITYSDISRTSAIREVAFFNNSIREVIKVNINNRYGILSAQFIEYLKHKKWSINARYNYVFDISDWDFRQPFIILPKKQFNNSDLSNEIKQIIEGKVENLLKRNGKEAIIENLWELFRLINSQLTVNFSIIQTILYASTLVDPLNDDARLPKDSQEAGLGVLDRTMSSRSLGAFFAFQDTARQLIRPISFFELERQDSVMDVFLDPENTIKSYY